MAFEPWLAKQLEGLGPLNPKEIAHMNELIGIALSYLSPVGHNNYRILYRYIYRSHLTIEKLRKELKEAVGGGGR